jgi:hypothetical protein
MNAAIQYVADDGRFVTFELDAVTAESHAHAAQVTEFPIESGASINDHVIQKPDAVKLSGIVTNTPLPSNLGWDVRSFVAGGIARTFGRRASDAYWALLELKEAGTPVSLRTDLRDYMEMVLTSINVPREHGDALFAELSFQKVSRVGTRTVPVPTIPKAAAKVKKGHQTTTPADGATREIADSAFRGFKRAVAP